MALKSIQKKTDVLLLNDETANHTYTISLNKKRTGTKIKICTKKKPKSKKSVTKAKALPIKDNEDVKDINTNVAKELTDSASYMVIRDSQNGLSTEIQVKENTMDQQPQIRLVKVTNKNLQGKPSFVILENAETKRRLIESIRTEKMINGESHNDCSSTVASQTDDYLLKNVQENRIISNESAESVIKSNAEQERFLQTHLKLGELRALRLRAERSRKISHVHNLANMSHIIPQEFVSSKPVSHKTSLYSTPSRRRPSISLQSSLYSSNRLTRRMPLTLKRKQTFPSQLLQSATVESSENNFDLTPKKNQDAPNYDSQCKKVYDHLKIKNQESTVSKKSIETNFNSRIPQEHLSPNDSTWPKNDTNFPPQFIAVQHLTKSIQQTSDSPVIVEVGAPRFRTVNEVTPKNMRQENFVLEQPQQSIVQSKQQLGQLKTLPQHPCFLQATQTNPGGIVTMRPTYFVPPKQISGLLIDQNGNQQNSTNITINKKPIQFVNSNMWIPSCSTVNSLVGNTSYISAAGPNNKGSMQTVWSGNIQHPKQCAPQIMQYPSQYHIPYDQRTMPITNSSVNFGSQYHQQLSAGGTAMNSNSNEQFLETDSIPPIRSEAQNFPIYYNQTCRHALQNLQHIRTQTNSDQSSSQLRPHPQISHLNTSSSQYCYGNQQSAPYTYHPHHITPPSNRIYNSKQKYCCGNAMRSKSYRCTCSHCTAASDANSTALPDTLPKLSCYAQRPNLGGPTSTSMTGPEFGQNCHHYYAAVPNRLSSGACSYRPNFFYPPTNTCINQFNNQHIGKVPMTTTIQRQVELVPMYPSFIAMQCQEFNKNNTTATSKESMEKITETSENQHQDQGDNIPYAETPKSSSISQLEGSSVSTQSNAIEGEATDQKLITKGPPPPVPPKIFKYVTSKSGTLRFPTHYGIRFERSCLILRAQPTPVPILGKRASRHDSITA